MKLGIELILMLLLLAGCGTSKKLKPTSFYRLQGTDTVSMASHFVQPDSLRILLVKMTEDTTALMNSDNLGRNRNRIETFMGTSGPTSGGAGAYHGKVSGQVRNQWLNDVALSKISNRLPALGVMHRKSVILDGSAISRQSLDSLLECHDANWVISVDSILFQLDAEHARFIQYMDRDYLIEQPGWFAVDIGGYENSSSSAVVDYQMYLTLYRVDTNVRKVAEEIHLLQKGGYKSDGISNSMELVFRCALKAGDDFTLLFKPGDNQ